LKFTTRWKNLTKHKNSIDRGPLWDNIGTPGPVGAMQTTVQTSNSVPARTSAFTPGPSSEPYLKSSGYKDPFAPVVAFNHLQPRIPVREPWAVSSVYIQNTQPQSGLPQTSDVNQGKYIAEIKALAPPMTRQRDNLYDAANSTTLQRGTFITASQQYFNERTPIVDFVAPSYYTNQVTTNMFPIRPGWSQEYVPDPGMRYDTVGASPPYQLSTPISVTTIVNSGVHTKPMHAKSPKRKRTGG
jgi:hypothetical protein